MSRYFNYFPKTYYSTDNKNPSLDVVTNIIARYSFDAKIKENTSAFYQYEVKDSDTPEIIAGKYYDNPERHWIILLFNDIIDPQYDWPLQDRNLMKFIDAKYTANTANTAFSTGLTWAKSESNPQAYYKVFTTTTSDQTTIEKLEVDATTYANTQYMLNGFNQTFSLQDGSYVNVLISKEIKTHFDYELELNEEKRKIKLLKKEFIPEVEKEYKRVISS